MLPLGTVRFRLSRATTPPPYRLVRPVVETAASVVAVSRGHVARMRAIDSAGAAPTPPVPPVSAPRDSSRPTKK